jgi:hypothetical protein
VALAVAMPDGGLITPVLKDADKTDIYQMSRLGVTSVIHIETQGLLFISPRKHSNGWMWILGF